MGKGKQFGGGAGPAGTLLHERRKGLDNGVGVSAKSDGRRQGGDDGLFGGAKGWGGCDGPGGGVGEAGRGGEVDGIEAAESGAEGGTQSAEEAGAGRFELTPEIGFGEAALGRDWREGDGEGAVGQVGAGVPVEAGGHGEEDGAFGETAERAGDSVGGVGDVVEGQDPVVVSEGQQSGFGEREGAKESGGRIDQGAEHSGGGGLAAAGWSLKDEDGIGTRGAEGGKEPGEAAEPVRGVGEIQE
jgi:hypothetical protein